MLREEYEQIFGNEDELPVDFFMNFKAIINATYTGTIIDVDNSTENVLFVIKMDDGTEKLIPAVDDFVISMDMENKMIELSVPDALLDL